MSHISKKDVQELREKLEREREDLEQELAEHGKKTSGDWRGTPEGFEGNEADETVVADRLEELATNIPLVEQLEARLRDVSDALKKMDEGTYGICEKTDEPIPLARLQANPAARTRVEHS